METEDGEQAAATRPQAIVATTATMAAAARAGRDPLAFRRALPIASLFPAHIQHDTGPARRTPDNSLVRTK